MPLEACYGPAYATSYYLVDTYAIVIDLDKNCQNIFLVYGLLSQTYCNFIKPKCLFCLSLSNYFKDKKGNSSSEMKFHEKWYSFFQAPAVKFHVNLVSA